MSRAGTILGVVLALSMASCRTEDRPYRPSPATARSVHWIRLSELQPGPAAADDAQAPRIVPSGAVPNAYEENAYALSEGKRLYSAFNCNGCHAHGGGDIGPPFIDDKWIYGHQPEQVFASIVEGRPNGMPSFGARIAEYQVWWLVAYVRSLGGLVDKTAATARDDHMKTGPPENSKSTPKPVESATPKSTEIPK
jgi:cytochrome c oxidase cbb3-type subunit 3